jgi:hypothetical protein
MLTRQGKWLQCSKRPASDEAPCRRDHTVEAAASIVKDVRGRWRGVSAGPFFGLASNTFLRWPENFPAYGDGVAPALKLNSLSNARSEEYLQPTTLLP